MRISDWSSDVCSSDLCQPVYKNILTGVGKHINKRFVILMIVAGAQTLGNADASQAAPWPLLNAGSAASSVHFWPTAVRHIPATHIANAAYQVMSVSATNRPVCIQNNNGPLRRLGERPYEGIIPVAKPRTRRTANRTAKAKGKIDALMTTDYGCSLRGSQCLHMVACRWAAFPSRTGPAGYRRRGVIRRSGTPKAGG